MSRIGKAPIVLPSEVNVSITNGCSVNVKGPKGELTLDVNPDLVIKNEEGV